MKKIAFHGASGDVTGSAYVLTAKDDTQILVDFGMFQGPTKISDLNYHPLGFNPSSLKAVFLTHAHLDHCGRLPLLVFGGFNGKIYMTAPTFALIEVILTDAAKIAEEKVGYEPLYTSEEVQKLLAMVEVVEYHQEISVGPFKAKFRDAGHILGSASIEIVDTLDSKKIVFSGDLGNTPEDIIKPTEFIDDADIVVMESTYGDKIHPVEDPSQILMEEINKIEDTMGVLLIPAFSLERTQEILHRINHLKMEGKVRADTPVFMDSPMGIRATEIFRQFKEYYNEELQTHEDDPFAFEGLYVTIEARDSREIIKAMEPKVIIAGSGMLSGGRMLHHANNYLALKTTRILFVGYQAEETLGRKVLNGAKNIVIRDRNKDKNLTVRASVREIKTLSSHADQNKLINWLGHIKGATKVFLIHGENESRQVLADRIKKELQIKDIIIPQNGQEHILQNAPVYNEKPEPLVEEIA